MDFPIETIKQALEMAGAGIQSVGALADLTERAKRLFKSPEKRTDAEVEALLAELTSQVAKTQFANAELHVRLTTLLLAMQEANETKAKLARYELRRTEGGDLVYALRDGEQNAEPDHFACPKCFEEGRRSILQSTRHGQVVLQCKSCQSAFRGVKPPPSEARPRVPGRFKNWME